MTASRDFAKLWEPTQADQSGIRRIFSRLFLSRAELAAKYHISPESPRLPFYYAVRAKDLAYNFLPLTWQMWRGDARTHTAVIQTAELDSWLSTPTPPCEGGEEPTGAADT